MKIVLISDSHGNKVGIDKIFKNIKFDYLFFVGDGLNDLGDYVYLDNVFAVSGNCDFFSRLDNEKYCELQNKKIFYTHGNKYGVKLGLSNLVARAKELNVDFVFYGHTHNQKVERIGDVYYINPGSFHIQSNGKSYGLLLDIKDDKWQIDDLIIE